MKIFKASSLILVVVLLLGLFSACGSSDSTSNSDTAADKAATVNYLDENGEARYTIVRPQNPTNGEGTLAGTIFKRTKSVLGVNVKNVDDTTDGTDKYEILIGNTNRPESAKALEMLKAESSGRYQDYIICVIGKKIVINSIFPDGLNLAVTAFCDEFLSTGTVDNVYKIGKTEGDFTDLAVNNANIGRFKIVRPHYNTSYILQTEITSAIDTIKQLTGYYVPLVEDAYEAEGDYEIVIGNCNRKGVEPMTALDDYYVKVSGKKIYINGGTDHATAVALKEFMKAIKDNQNLTDAFSLSGNYTETVNTYDKSAYYTYVWGDEFNDTELDLTKWHYVEYRGAGQNGLQSARTRDIFTFDGTTMTMTPTFDETAYYGGMIYSDTRFTYKYGYLEISTKIPDAGGFWSSLWLCGKGHAGGVKKDVLLYPEIDVNESDGHGKVVAANCHSWPGGVGEAAGYVHTSCDGSFSSMKKRYALDGRTFNDDFHTFGFLWTDKEMTFTCDGEIYFTFDTTTCEQDIITYNQHQFLIISLAVGLGHGSAMTTDDSVWNDGRSIYSVDWVRLYQLDDGKSEVSNGFVY